MRRNDAENDMRHLLEEARSSRGSEKTAHFARRMLEEDPDNPEGLLLLAKTSDSDQERIDLLERARENCESRQQGIGSDIGLLVDIMQELVVSLLAEGRAAEGIDVSREILEYDPDNMTLARTLLYRCLIEDGRYSEVLEESFSDPDPSPAREHSRAIAAFLMEGVSPESWKALWEVFRTEAAIPFLMLGYLDTSGDEETDAFAEFYADAWSVTVPLRNWLTGGMLLFGELTGRFDAIPEETLRIFSESLRLDDILEEAKTRLFEAGDTGRMEASERDALILGILESITSGRKIG
jgi:hypothetical protein